MDREKIMNALHCRAQDLMIDLPACDKCDYQIHMVNRNGCDYRRLCKDSISLLKEQEEKIRQLESLNVSASGNGTAIGVLHGGMTIKKEYRQQAKEVYNIGHVDRLDL